MENKQKGVFHMASLPTVEEYISRSNAEIETLTARLAAATNTVEKLQTQVNDHLTDMSDIDRAKAFGELAIRSKEVVELKAQINEEKEKLAVLERQKESSQDEGASSKIINTQKVTSNLRELLKYKDVKIGQIEKDAGAQPGYLSRFEKDPTKTPSIDFLYTAANELEVSLDALLDGNFGSLTKNEIYLLSFLSQLERSTNNESMSWIAQSVVELHEAKLGDDHMPLLVSDSDINGNKFARFEFQLHIEGNISIAGNAYYSGLDDKDSYAYIIKLHSVEKNKDFYVLYIVKRYVVNPENGQLGVSADKPSLVCDSLQVRDELKSGLESVYKAAELSATHVHLAEDTKSIIDSFMMKK